MARYFLRSLLFNIVFFGVTLLACVAALPALFLPRKGVMCVVYSYLRVVYWIEKYVLGLNYEIRGKEYLPKNGSYIVAAKHQSAYETLKLHALFGDPAIILKKELLSLPLWGQYLKKSDVIAIDRSTPDAAIQSIQEGAQRVAAQGRPIVIFPQGTRVGIDQQKRYKIGVVRVQEATGLPIIPMALNAGYFWPRNSFFKRPGKVIFEFLPPIEAGKAPDDILQHLESEVERHSKDLLAEAQQTKPKTGGLFLTLATLAALYTGGWFWAADQIKDEYISALHNSPQVSGFPGPINLSNAQATIPSDQGDIVVSNLNIRLWPLPGQPVKVESAAVIWNGMQIDHMDATLRQRDNNIIVDYLHLHMADSILLASGIIEPTEGRYPNATFAVMVEEPQGFLTQLSDQGILKPDQAMMVATGISGFQNDGKNTIPLRLNDGSLYLGPLRLARLP